MQHPAHRRPSVGRLSAVALAVALLGGLTAACTTPSTGSTNTAQDQFCSFFDKAQTAPPAPDNAVLVKDQVVALADDTTVTGSSCTQPGAKVGLDGAVLAQGQEVPAQTGSGASTEKVAAVTGNEIGSGAPVLENLSVNALSADIGVNGITVRGNVNVRLSGVTSTIGFVGTLANLNNWSVTLSSAALTIPGITTSPVVFTGTLASVNGTPSLTMTALASSAKIGDVTVTGATVKLKASPATGVQASVAGNIKVGPTTASGTVDVDFDKAGALVSANADISAHLVAPMAGGKTADLTGTVKLVGNAQQTTVTFSGSGVVGDLVVNEANGSLTLATNKATFIGVLDVKTGPITGRFDGSIVWDGTTASTPFLQLQGAGQFSGTLNDGSTVTVSGDLSTEVIGTQLVTNVTGAFKIGTLQGTGTAQVYSDGVTTTLDLDAALSNAGFSAQVQGAVVITDGVAETVSLDAAVNGAISLGDVTLTGANLHIGSSYGAPLEFTFAGGLKIGTKADLSGSVAGSFGPNGSLLSLTGSLNGSLLLDSWGVANFNGTVVASPEQVTLSGSGNVSVINFPLGVSFNGSLTSSLQNPSWSLNGTGRLKIASIDVAQARLSLSQSVGMKATRVGFYFSIIGIPTYFEGNFYMKPTGGCSKVDITGGSFLAKPILALALPGIIGCPVNI
jgi:hypothetical protein